MAGRKPVHQAYLAKEPSRVQSEFAAWIEKTTGHVVPEGDVALVQRLYPLYLKTPEVKKARAAEKAARDKEAAEREKRVKEQKQARLVALEQQRHRLMQELGLEPEGEVPTLAVVPDPEPEPVDEDQPKVLVLGGDEAADEFVETDADGDPITEEDDGDEDPLEGEGLVEDDDLWDEDTSDDGEDDF